MGYTTYKLHGGSLGNGVMYIRCNLSRASSPVQVDYANDPEDGNCWQPTQYQCADTRHTDAGLIRIGKELAAQAIEEPEETFECETIEV